MNFLQMAQFVQAQIGTSADLPWAGPSTVVGATGQYLEIQNWVQMAYKSIQEDQPDWGWRNKQGVLQLQAGVNLYSIANIQTQTAFSVSDANMTQGTATLTTTSSTPFSAGNVGNFVTVTGAGNNGANLTAIISAYGANNSVTLNTNAGHTVANVAANNLPLTGLTDFESLDALHFLDDSKFVLVYDATQGVGNETHCWFINYQDWRGWKDRQVLPTGKPVWFTKRYDIGGGSIEVNPIPDVGNYVMVMDYRTAVDTLAISDTAAPLYMPARYHEAICWRAVMYWAQQRENQAKYAGASTEYQRIMNRMYAEFLPEVQPYVMEYFG